MLSGGPHANGTAEGREGSASTAGKKVLTYSRRRPVAYETIPRNVKQVPPGVDTHNVDSQPEGERDKLLIEISERIKKLNIVLPHSSLTAMDKVSPTTPRRSRRSEVRPPRQSIAPSQLEYETLLRACGQIEEMSFEEWLTAIKCDYPSIEKIGESSFSEVFRLVGPSETLAVKIMPILRPGAQAKDDNSLLDRTPEPIPTAHLLHEIESLRALERLRASRKYAVPSGYTGFNRLAHCMLVSGPYPSELLQVWDVWTSTQGEAGADGTEEPSSLNDRPDFYNSDSLHIIITMEFGGISLEDYPLSSLAQVHAILCQLCSSIALAEENIRFEHRDLHLGNVLIHETHRSDVRLDNYQCIPTAGLLCSIIDCSLARFQDPTEQVAHYRDLHHEDWLFAGDADESRQYQMYRDMRDLVGGAWDKFHPSTNMLWISYVAEELLAKFSKLAKSAKEKANYEALSSLISTLQMLTVREALTALLNLKIK